jgi:hypothetical protein
MSERLYRLLLRFYPRPFHERYAEEMLRVFRDRLRDERALRVWIDVLVDALVSIPKQHLTVIRSHVPYPRSASPFYAKTVGAAFACGMSLGALFAASIVAAFFIPGGWIVTVVMAGVFIAGAWTGQRRIKWIRNSYRAESTDDAVTVSCAPVGMTPLTLSRSDDTALHLVMPLGLRIHAVDPARDLWVPAGTPDYDAVRVRLSQWAPLKESSLGAALLDVDAPWYPVFLSLLCVISPLWTLIYVLAAFCALNAVPQVLRKRSASRIVLSLVPAAIVLARRFL